MILTLSIDERVAEKARLVARSMGKSLNQLVRDYLFEIAADDRAADDIAEVRRLSLEGQVASRGWRFNRDDLHERS